MNVKLACLIGTGTASPTKAIHNPPHAQLPPDLDVFGCTQCGEMFTAKELAQGPDKPCPKCDDGILTPLGGTPNAAKAQALIAWARKDATSVIEGWGMGIGAALGFVLTAFASVLLPKAQGALLPLILYGGVFGGLLGQRLAVPIHRRLRPGLGLVYLEDESKDRRRTWALLALALLPIIILPLMKLSGTTPKHLIGQLWMMLGG